jgi:hypothetical protein
VRGEALRQRCHLQGPIGASRTVYIGAISYTVELPWVRNLTYGLSAAQLPNPEYKEYSTAHVLNIAKNNSKHVIGVLATSDFFLNIVFGLTFQSVKCKSVPKLVSSSFSIDCECLVAEIIPT